MEMTGKSIYRMSKHGTYLLKNNKKLYNWINESDEIVDELLNNLVKDNEQLKRENMDLKQQNSRLMMEVAEYSRELRKCKGDME